MILRFFRGTPPFRTRSPDRDARSDRERVAPISAAIDKALASAESEREGLKQRLDDVITRASIVGGYDADEQLTRDATDESILHNADSEIRSSEQRLITLGEKITHLRFLRAAFRSRFPEAMIEPVGGEGAPPAASTDPALR